MSKSTNWKPFGVRRPGAALAHVAITLHRLFHVRDEAKAAPGRRTPKRRPTQMRGVPIVLTWGAVLFSMICITGFVIAQQKTTPPQVRRPLPKPPTGARGFEKYSGKDATSRLVAAGATREVVTPRKPLAPLEGRAYENRPFFAWQASFGSKSYHFALYEGDMYADKAAKSVYEKDVAGTEFSYPADAPPLTPGKLYSWRVSTPSANGREDGPSVSFQILSGNEAAEVKRAIEQAQLNAPKTVTDYLDLATVFENYGVWYDALRLANEVATQNPDHTQAQQYYDELLNKLDEKPKP